MIDLQPEFMIGGGLIPPLSESYLSLVGNQSSVAIYRLISQLGYHVAIKHEKRKVTEFWNQRTRRNGGK